MMPKNWLKMVLICLQRLQIWDAQLRPWIILRENIGYAPGKAVNAGGVAVSGLEMSQNSMRISWPREEVDARLKVIMENIHEACVNLWQS
jgi:glutamate dehydrogenase/leucine dehydrogenase